jgi:hypothetical protein
MANDKSRSERNKEELTPAELENLKERIAIMVHDGEMDESLAERIAIERILEQRKEELF